MSKSVAIRSLAKEGRTDVSQPQENLSQNASLGDSEVGDGTCENAIQLRAYEIYFQRLYSGDAQIHEDAN